MIETLTGWAITIPVLLGVAYYRYPKETKKAFHIGKQVISTVNKWRKGR